MNYFSLLDDSDNEEGAIKFVAPKTNKEEISPPVASKAASKKTSSAPVAVASKKSNDNKSRPPRAEKPVAETEVAIEASKSQRDNKNRGKHDDRRRAKKVEGEESNTKTTKKSQNSTGGTKVKKDGAGPHNSGSTKQEALNGEKDASNVKIEAIDTFGERKDEEVVETEPESVTRSLDDFMALRIAARSNPSLRSNKAAREVEKIDTSSFVKKEECISDFLDGNKGKRDNALKTKQRAHGIQVLEASFTLAPNQEPEEERRGGDRKGGDRRNDRKGGRDSRSPRSSPRSNGAAVDLTDANLFPSL